MQIHELNNFTGTLGAGSYVAMDDGNDTGKLSHTAFLSSVNARIDNIIAGEAPSAEEIVDARLGDDGVVYPSLGDAIRDQFSDVKSALQNITDNDVIQPTGVGEYLTTNTGVGSVVDFNSPVTNGSLNYYVIPCDEGDIFTVSISGGGAPRGYAWLDANQKILYALPQYQTYSGELHAIANAKYLVINDNSNGYVYRGRLVGSIAHGNDFGRVASYISLSLYSPKIVNNAHALPTINSVSNDEIAMTCASAYRGVAYTIPVVKNTDYVISCHIDVTSGEGFWDVATASQSALIASAASALASGDHELSFNSGANEYVCIRLGNATSVNAIVAFSKLFMFQKGNLSIDNTLTKSGYSADAKEVGDAVTSIESQDAVFSGWINYYNDTLSYEEGSGWHYSNYIPLDGVREIIYKNLQVFIYAQNNVAVAFIAFYDSSKNLISAMNGIDGIVPSSMTQYVTSGSILEFPSNAAYVRFSENDSNDWSFTLKKELEKSIDHLDYEISKLKTPKLYGYSKKVNIIGDSISQGVGVEVTYDDSYAGILRKMLMIENDGKMNYGFEPFPSLSELTTITETMVNLVSSSGFSRKWNGTDCYGSDEWSSSTVGATITFLINRAFKYMKVSYKNGVAGSFAVKAGNTTLLTVSVSNGTVAPALSDAIDISAYPATQQYTIEVLSGAVTVSGVELGKNTSYPTFNNYGRAGIPMDTVGGTLLTAEADCDLLIYALGTNGTVTAGKISSVETALGASGAEIIVLDLCMKSSHYNNTAKSAYLEQLANALGATYIRMYELIPTDSSGYTDASYFISDGLHPSELGHRCIAEAVSKTQKLSVQSKGLASATFTEW